MRKFVILATVLAGMIGTSAASAHLPDRCMPSLKAWGDANRGMMPVVEAEQELDTDNHRALLNAFLARQKASIEVTRATGILLRCIEPAE